MVQGEWLPSLGPQCVPEFFIALELLDNPKSIPADVLEQMDRIEVLARFTFAVERL